MSYLCPSSLDEALSILGRGSWRVVCGATDCYAPADTVPGRFDWLDISRIASLSGIRVDGGDLVIGAATTWKEIARCHELPGMLRDAARQVGSTQIQQVATVGGNLCNAAPAADGVPPLMALDAVVELSSQAGTRSVPVPEFIVGRRLTTLRHDELLTSIRFRRATHFETTAFHKFGNRQGMTIAVVSLAMRLTWTPDATVRAARVVVGSASEVPVRARMLEDALTGRHASELEAACSQGMIAEIQPISDLRASAEFRAHLARIVAQRACTQLAKELDDVRDLG